MQIVVIITLTLVSILQARGSFNSVTSDRQFISRNSRFRPLVTKSLNQLIYASFPAYPQPKIKLESELVNNLPCEIDFPTMDDIEYPLNLDSLANGKLILSFMGSEDLLYRYLLTLIVDTDKCEFSAVMTTLNGTNDKAVVLTGEDEFDIFFTRHQHCVEYKACRLRYSDDGQLIGVTEFDIPEDAVSWSFISVREKNFTDGYFYSVRKNNSTVVQRLEQDLKVQKERTIAKSFLYSASHGSVSNCRGTSASNLECDLHDDEFECRSRALVEMEYFKSFMRGVKLFNLSDGSVMILYILQVYVEPSIANQFTTYLQHVDLHGDAGNPVKFQEDVCKDFKEIGMTWMRDNFYCFNVYCRDMIFIKCAAVGKM